MRISKIPTRIERFRGCILGGAVGDALGAPVEGKTKMQIVELYGRVDSYVNNVASQLRPGQWTDDTALSLAALQSIIESESVNLDDINFKMGMSFNLEPERGYGKTIRKALSLGRIDEESASNGAAMRIAPVALYSSYNVDELRSNVQNVSRLTHINSEAINGAMAVAFAIASAVNGQLRPHSIIGETIDFLGATEMSSKLKEVEALLKRSELTIEQGLGQLGTRGYVLESVGSAFYAFLKTPLDFCKSLVNAINAGGDTDSIGSLTGAISGAFNGINSIPTKWINNLEDKNRLDEYSCRLYRLTEARQPLS